MEQGDEQGEAKVEKTIVHVQFLLQTTPGKSASYIRI